MYMTIKEFQEKLNNLLKNVKEIDKNTLITAATVIEPGDVGFGKEKRTYPPGTILFVCRNSINKEGKVNAAPGKSESWYELSVIPDKVDVWMQ